jgi:hypothetical protein
MRVAKKRFLSEVEKRDLAAGTLVIQPILPRVGEAAKASAAAIAAGSTVATTLAATTFITNDIVAKAATAAAPLTTGLNGSVTPVTTIVVT